MRCHLAEQLGSAASIVEFAREAGILLHLPNMGITRKRIVCGTKCPQVAMRIYVRVEKGCQPGLAARF